MANDPADTPPPEQYEAADLYAELDDALGYLRNARRVADHLSPAAIAALNTTTYALICDLEIALKHLVRVAEAVGRAEGSEDEDGDDVTPTASDLAS